MNNVSPRWEDPRTVAGFVTGAPNQQLLAFAGRFVRAAQPPRCLDLGCGAARNSLPLAAMGFHVTGTDLSMPMIDAAQARASREGAALPVEFIHAPMTPLPFERYSFDLIVAHGIWNLARSDSEFRSAVREAARVARHGAGLFVFIFSRHTLDEDAVADPGESFIYSAWNGEPQCFLSENELVLELAEAGFLRDADAPITEYNRPASGALHVGGPPVIYEATFIRSRHD